MTALFSDDLHESAFPAATIKFAVKNLLPRAEVQFAFRDCYHNPTAHHLTLQMRIGVVLACPIMVVLRDRFVRG